MNVPVLQQMLVINNLHTHGKNLSFIILGWFAQRKENKILELLFQFGTQLKLGP